MYDLRVTPTARYVPHFLEFRWPFAMEDVLRNILAHGCIGDWVCDETYRSVRQFVNALLHIRAASSNASVFSPRSCASMSA